jgi:hypothetical protein
MSHIPSRSTVAFVGCVVFAMLAGGVCAAPALRFAGVRIFWHLPLIAPATMLLAMASARCPGGRGVVRCFRGALAIVLGFGALVLFSMVFGVVYRVMWRA